MLKGFKNFMMRGDVIVASVAFVVALSLSTLIKAFTDDVINPLVTRVQGGGGIGLGVQLGTAGNATTFLNIGAFISAIIYFGIFMAVVYFAIVVPYKSIQARRGLTVFGEPAATKSCPECLSSDLPMAATRCLHCGAPQPAAS